MFPSKTLQWTMHDDSGLVTQDTQDFGPPRFLSSGNTWPTESFSIVCRQNKCNVIDPQAEARPSVSYVRSVLFLAGLDYSCLDSQHLSLPFTESSS